MWYDKTAKKRADFDATDDVEILKDSGKWEPGKVIKVCKEPRLYIVRDSQSKLLRRNKIFLRKGSMISERKIS